MQSRINGTTMPVLEFRLEPNEAVISEAGELSWMSSSIQMTTHTQFAGGGGVFGVLKRVAGGGSLFMDRDYLKEEPLDPPNIFVDTTLSFLGLFGLWRVFQRDLAIGVRFAIVLVFFPLTYYLSHPETYYFRPVDPLIVILAAVAIAGRTKKASPLQVPATAV